MIGLTEFITEAVREDELYRFMYIGRFLDDMATYNNTIRPAQEYDRLYKKDMKFISTTRQIDAEGGYAYHLIKHSHDAPWDNKNIMRIVFDKHVLTSKYKVEPYAYFDGADKSSVIDSSPEHKSRKETIMAAKGKRHYTRWREENLAHQKDNEVEERVYTNTGIPYKYIKEIHVEQHNPDLEDWAKENKIPIKVLGRKFRFGR